MHAMTRTRVAVAASVVLLALLTGCGANAEHIAGGASVPTSIPNTEVTGFGPTGGQSDSPTTTEPSTASEPAPTTSSPAGIADPDAAVKRIVLHASDLPSFDDPGQKPVEGPHTTDACRFMSASPWVGNVVGPNFGILDVADWIIYGSQAVIEPTPADADAILAKTDDDSFLQTCQLHTSHQILQGDLDDTNASTDCGLSITSEELTRLPAAELAAGVRGWKYHAVVHCARENSDMDYTDSTYLAKSGSIVVSLSVGGYRAADRELVNSSLSKMLDRARQEQQEAHS